MADARQVTKLLVANRGEIARRVISTCGRMGVATVAVHSEPDASAPFVGEADEAVSLGGAAAADSYLRGDAIVAAAEATGADAVHPGYGFLAESAGFARQVLDAGLTWVGPPPEAIEAMGSKVRARAMMEKAGVPVLPGAEISAESDVAAEAERVGFPLLVKASAGGGGKGMRAVRGAAELESAVEGAKREAESAFGDGTVFLERMLERPRHVEIQVFADRHGNTVSLGERECSIQRRHQKVVEEAPSTAVSPELRERMGAAAVAAAEAVGYEGAGTVEFLLGADGEFFFLEMNTRLQVEHPVTELVYGLDLVRLQLLVASGEALPEAALEPRIDGHAVEVRLYAEDPAGGYLPQTGTVERIRFRGAVSFAAPAGREAGLVRLDSGIEDGSEVSPYYDPMLGKVIAWAPTRAEATARLAAVLAAAELDGPVNNRDFLVRVLRDAEFGAGETDTGFLERHEGLGEPLVSVSDEARNAAAAALATAHRPGRPLSFAAPGWRNNPAGPQTLRFEGARGEVEVAYALARGELELAVDGEPLEGARLHGLERDEDGSVVDLEAAGVRSRHRVRRRVDARGAVTHHVNGPVGQSSLLELPRYPNAAGGAAEGAIVAPMPGRVIRVVEAGAQVAAGDVVAVLEAMKMEHELTAPADGVVAESTASEGDQVEAGAVLAVLDESTAK